MSESSSEAREVQDQGLLRHHQAETWHAQLPMELEYNVVFLVYIIDGVVCWIDEVIFIEWHADLSLPSEQSDLLQINKRRLDTVDLYSNPA